MSESIKLHTPHQAHCKDCSLASLCLPLSLNLEDMDALDEIVKRGRPLKKGEFLFRQGDAFNSVFAVRSGALKTFSLSDSGDEQITGFHLPSELVGLSGMDSDAYPVSAMALETTSVCEIPFERLDELSVQLPQLRRQLMRIKPLVGHVGAGKRQRGSSGHGRLTFQGLLMPARRARSN